MPPGGFLDDYGVMFTLSDGAVVDMYSNGGSGGSIYGAVVWPAGARAPTTPTLAASLFDA